MSSINNVPLKGNVFFYQLSKESYREFICVLCLVQERNYDLVIIQSHDSTKGEFYFPK